MLLGGDAMEKGPEIPPTSPGQVRNRPGEHAEKQRLLPRIERFHAVPDSVRGLLWAEAARGFLPAFPSLLPLSL